MHDTLIEVASENMRQVISLEFVSLLSVVFWPLATSGRLHWSLFSIQLSAQRPFILGYWLVNYTARGHVVRKHRTALN